MFRSQSATLAACRLRSSLALHPPPHSAQTRNAAPGIRVDHYTIDAEIQPATQALIATAEVRFVPLDNNTSSAVFELNNALTVSRVVDGKGAQINDTRNQQDSTVRLTFDQPLAKGQQSTAEIHLRRAPQRE